MRRGWGKRKKHPEGDVNCEPVIQAAAKLSALVSEMHSGLETMRDAGRSLPHHPHHTRHPDEKRKCTNVYFFNQRVYK